MRRAAEATPLELEPDPRDGADARDVEPPDGGRETAEREGARVVPAELRVGALRVAELRIEELSPDDEDRIEPDLELELDRGGLAFERDGALRSGSVTRLRMEALPLERVCGADARSGAGLRGTAFELPCDRMPCDRMPCDPRDSVVARGGPLRMISGDEDRTLSGVADPLDDLGTDDRMPLLDLL